MATGRQRLARYVTRDRARLWPSREAFAEAAGLGLRTVVRIEQGEAGRLQESTKARVEAVLGWADGSVDRVIGGGRPVYVRDAEMAELMRLWPGLSRDARRMLVRLARDAD